MFRDVWTFADPVEKRIADFVSKHPGLWLHAPAGQSKLGKLGGFDKSTIMYTLDRDASTEPDMVWDLFKLKECPTIADIMEQNGGFDGVISDPVWLKIDTCDSCKEVIETDLGISYPGRRHLSYSIRNVLKPGGWALVNGLWNPEVKGLELTNPKTNPAGTPIEVGIQNFNSFRNLALLFYLQRKNERLDFC